jgi:DNA-binding CsgD family transcriptional regulator
MGLTRGALLGRDEEVKLLERVLDDARDGDAGFVIISGEAGIGKTSLLEKLREVAAGSGCLTLAGRASEFDQELPFGLFTDALDAYLDSLHRQALDRLAMDRLGDLAAVFPSMHALGEAVEHPASVTERFRVHHAVRELLERLAAGRPLVLILDDLQWADGASLELIAYLLRHPPQAEVMVAMALRPGPVDPALARTMRSIQTSSLIHNVELGPLPIESVRLLVGDDAQELHHVSGGNPFYALQLARSPAVAGQAESWGGREVPSAVARAIAAELATLSPTARNLAEAAAVVGDPFDIDIAAAASGRSEKDVFEELDELVAKDMMRVTDVPRRFQFRHPIVRSAVYGSCAPSVRIQCHQRAVDALANRGSSAGERAHHVEQSARYGDSDAISLLRQAGNEAANQAPTTSVRWFMAALRLLPGHAPAAQRVDLLALLAASQAALGLFTDALAALEECIDLTASEGGDVRVEMIVGCAELEQLMGHHGESRARLKRAYDELTDPGSPAGVSLLIALSSASLYLADHQGMLEWGRLAVVAADTLGNKAVLAAALAAHTMGAAFAGQIALALEMHDRAARFIDSAGDHVLTARLDALSNLATAELYLDLHAQGCVHGERALALARATGRTQSLPILTPILGTSLAMAGEMRRSEEVLDDAIEAARLVDNAQGLSLNLFNRALSAVMAGDLETALDVGAESVRLARSVDNGVITAFAGAIHAQTLLESGDANGALELLLESVGGEEVPLLAGGWRAHFLELLTRCNLELGRRSEAEAAATRVRRLAHELGLGLPGLMADRAGAAVAMAGGEYGVAVELARSAIQRSEEIGAPVHAATSRALAGRALAGAGRSDEAILELEGASIGFESVGALRYRDQVDAQLRQLGRAVHRRTRPGQTDGTGLAALTGRELEVADLVLDRRTNREIAAELFLSTKTVETHMRNIFNKLGVSSRVEVARALADVRERAGQSV